MKSLHIIKTQLLQNQQANKPNHSHTTAMVHQTKPSANCINQGKPRLTALLSVLPSLLPCFLSFSLSPFLANPYPANNPSESVPISIRAHSGPKPRPRFSKPRLDSPPLDPPPPACSIASRLEGCRAFAARPSRAGSSRAKACAEQHVRERGAERSRAEQSVFALARQGLRAPRRTDRREDLGHMNG